MRRASRAGAAIGLGLLLGAPHAGMGQPAPRSALTATARFAFYSDFDTNLNDALMAAGVARRFRRPELFRSGAEATCFAALPPSVRAGWEGAADYYAKVVSPADWTDREQYLLRVQLAGIDEEWKEPADRQFVEIARGFRQAAAPAYQACRWPAQHDANRRWIQELQPRLAAHERTVAARLEQLYAKRWEGRAPLPVDVVQTVNWSGANSIVRGPGGGHLLISNENRAEAALEVTFHEASHVLMDRGDPVRQALDRAAGAAGFRQPADLWHVVLFYTTGEVVRRALEESGTAGYTPMLYEIMARGGDWGRYRPAMDSSWRPYLDGQRTLPQAAADLIAALRQAQTRSPAP